MFILYAAKSITFFASQSLRDGPVSYMIPVILSGWLALRWRVIYNSRFYLLIFIFTGYFIAVSIKYQEIQPTFYIHWVFVFFVVYTAIKALRFKIFEIYEYLVFLLAIVALFMWSVQIILGGDTLFSYINRISFLKDNSYVTGYGVSAILYSVQPSEKGLLLNISFPRNCGFAWEPGSFGVFLCLAIFINLFHPKRDDRSKKRFLVLLAGLLSTLSTTGYVIFTVIIIFYLFNKKLQKIILLLPVLIIVLFFISSLPFMKDKILELIEETNRIDNIVETSIGLERTVNPQRFTSFKIALVDFLDNPILGLAAHREETWTYKIGANVAVISGIGNLMAQFGIFGLVPFIILSVRSSFLFARYYSFNAKFLFFIILMLISISYTMLFTHLIMCFWMLSMVEQPELNLVDEQKLVLEPDAKFV
jgi:hypothetical protein